MQLASGQPLASGLQPPLTLALPLPGTSAQSLHSGAVFTSGGNVQASDQTLASGNPSAHQNPSVQLNPSVQRYPSVQQNPSAQQLPSAQPNPSAQQCSASVAPLPAQTVHLPHVDRLLSSADYSALPSSQVVLQSGQLLLQSTTIAGATQQFASVPAHDSSIRSSAPNALAVRDHNAQARSQVAKHRAIVFARGQSDGGQQLCAIREDANES